MESNIMNLTNHDFPLGKIFFIANSLYPRMLLLSSHGELLVACPEFGDVVELEAFLKNYCVRFYNKDGDPGEYGPDATFYGVQFEVE